jgi:MYXO-CTERM domain-containing protein
MRQLLGSEPASAQEYFPLQIVLPRAAGTAPDPDRPTLSPDHFTLWAYPGVEYRMRAAVIGGHYPYTFELSGQPSGMAVDPAGVITWPDPRASSGEITLVVTDRDGVEVRSTWSITVDEDKFRFFDCDVTGSGTGTLEDPHRNLSDIPENTYAGLILYFRNCSAPGSYNALDRPRARPDRVDWNACCYPQQWLAYPGESPVLDLHYEEGGDPGTIIRFQGSPAAVVGFESIRGRHKHFNIIENVHYAVFWQNRMHQLAGVDGVNAGFLMSEAAGDLPAHYNVVQDNELYDWGAVYGGRSGSCIKIYSQYKLLIEDTVCRDAVGTSDMEGIALKGGVIERATIRNNVVHGVYAHGLGGNNHVLSSSEFLHNRVYDCGSNCAYFNQDGLIDSRISVYRNTFVGRVQIDHVGAVAGADFEFCNNVHVSDDALGEYFPGTRFVGAPVLDPSLVRVCDAPNEDVVATPGDQCVDAMGLLSDDGPADCRTNHLGLKGAELGDRPLPDADAGVPGADGGIVPGTDGGASRADGGTRDAATGAAMEDDGCGCRSTGGHAPWTLLLLPLALLRRRSR